MSFESKPTPGPTPEQVKIAKEMLVGSTLELESENIAKKPEEVMEGVWASDKKHLWPEGDDEAAKKAEKLLEGSEAEKWELK